MVSLEKLLTHSVILYDYFEEHLFRLLFQNERDFSVPINYLNLPAVWGVGGEGV